VGFLVEDGQTRQLPFQGRQLFLPFGDLMY